jgi:hypothetical protein
MNPIIVGSVDVPVNSPPFAMGMLYWLVVGVFFVLIYCLTIK